MNMVITKPGQIEYGATQSGVQINGVIWNMYLMALDRNFKNEPGFVFLSENDKEWIARALNPASADSPSILSDELRNKLMRIREELRDTVFIVFTDAVVQYLTIQMYSEQHGFPFSIERELKLAELLELPVFFISTDEFYPELKELARYTRTAIFLIAHTRKTKVEEMPDIDDIRDSSFVGQESDFVIMLWRIRELDDKAPGGYRYTERARLRLVKNRHSGRLGIMDLGFVAGKFLELIKGP